MTMYMAIMVAQNERARLAKQPQEVRRAPHGAAAGETPLAGELAMPPLAMLLLAVPPLDLRCRRRSGALTRHQFLARPTARRAPPEPPAACPIHNHPPVHHPQAQPQAQIDSTAAQPSPPPPLLQISSLIKALIVLYPAVTMALLTFVNSVRRCLGLRCLPGCLD